MKLLSRSGGHLACLLLACLLSGLLAPAHAFQPAEQNQNLEILLPAFDMEGVQSGARTAGSLSATNALTARYGGLWKVHSWNSLTNTARWVYGTSVPVTGTLRDGADVERAARQVIAGNTDVLHADASQLRLLRTPHAMGKWAAHFQQTWHGIDVEGGLVRIVFAEDGRLMLMGSDYHPSIQDLSPFPTLTEAQATEIARNGVPFDAATDRIEGAASLLVLPYPLSETEVEYHLVWKVRVRTEDPLGAWMTYVDAHSGQVLQRTNDIHFAYSGTTNTQVQRYGYCDGITGMTLPYLNITVQGVGNTVSDINGNWSINGTGGPRTVTSELKGPYVDIYNYGGAQAAFTGTAQENVPFTVSFLDVNAQNDERDTFDAVNDIHDFFELFDPGFHYSNVSINANVSRNSTCNAYWDGTINFYREGGGCANTGEMQQVVHHEFGHGIQNEIIGGQGGQGLGEGNGDITGNLITQDPIIGRGFYLNNCTSGIRNSVNTLRYPGDVVGQEIHYAGQVIAGFNWDAMVLLQAQYGTNAGTIMSGERWHFGRVLLSPQTQPDQVLATFVADDDNGNLDDGTPNHAIFCEAATNHGFDCPEILVGVYITHSGLPYTGKFFGTYDGAATIISLPQGQGQILDNTARTHYRVNGGGFNEAPLLPLGSDQYRVQIPAQPLGSVVEYYLSASDDNGNTGYSPRNAPADLHYFVVGSSFPDDMQAPTAWTAGATGDNASSGLWARVDPIGTTYNGSTAQPENDHTTDPGTICWITGNGSVGGAAGEADVDGGKTTLLSPRYDLTNATAVQVSYWKWYTNNLGNNPSQDYWYVDVTNDGGTSWTALEHTTESPNAWTEKVFNLLDYVPTPGVVQFRFIAEDLPSGSLVEAGVDDFNLVATFPTDAEELQVRLVTDLEGTSPNPFGAATEITYTLAQPGNVNLAVYDANGRLVTRLASGTTEAGSHRAVWNGTDASGGAVPAGVYFCRLDADGATHTARMILVR